MNEDVVSLFVGNQPDWAKQALAHILVHQQPDQAEALILDLAKIIIDNEGGYIFVDAVPTRRQRPYQPSVIHLEDRSGDSICGRTPTNLSTDRSEITCGHCERALHRPPKPPKQPPQRPDPDRAAYIVSLLSAGETLQTVSVKLGITRSRIGQIAQQAGFDTGQNRERIQAQRRAEKQAAYQEANTKPCRVCRKIFTGPRQICGDRDCQYIFRVGRRYIDPKHFETQRLAQARHVLRHPEQYKAPQVRSAQRVLNGAKPKRRYVIPGSEIAKALVRVGRADLIPGYPTAQSEHYNCRAISLSGEACKRWVAEEGMLCHVHDRARKHAF